VKMVVDLHGGSVAVDSQEGQGSRFTLRLPIKPPPQVAVTAPATAEATPAISTIVPMRWRFGFEVMRGFLIFATTNC